MSASGAPRLPTDTITLRERFAAASWLPGTSRSGLDHRVQVARPAPGVVAVRAAVAPAGPYLMFRHDAWRTYLALDAD